MADDKVSQGDLFGQEGPLCKRCKRPHTDKTMACADCLATARGQDRKKYARAKVDGRCHACNRPLDVTGVMCGSCTGKRRLERLRVKRACFDAYGGARCSCCGEETPEFLTLDHIAGNGAAERRKILQDAAAATGIAFYRRLKRLGFPPGYQVHCFNCNCAKRGGAICPHQEQGE